MQADIFARAAGAALLGAELLASGPAIAQTDPLGPARQGQLHCYEPNTAAKTCQSIGGYTFAADGRIDNPADVLIMAEPLVVMRVSSAVTVREGAVCGPLSREDIERAEFTIDGAPASPEDTQAIRAALQDQLASMIDVDVCTTYTPDGDGFRADVTMAGAPRPELTQRVIWIRPEDGYSIGP